MAVNPITGVDPEVDRFAIYRESTGQYVNMNAVWPVADGGPRDGNPDYKYYKRVSAERPDVDHRYTVNTTWAKVDADPTPDAGHPFGTYEEQHSTEKLSNEDLKIQVETEFQRQLRLQFPSTKDPDLLLGAGAASIRSNLGASLTTDQQAMVDAMVATDTAAQPLRARRSELFAAIDADEDYDIEAGWVIE